MAYYTVTKTKHHWAHVPYEWIISVGANQRWDSAECYENLIRHGNVHLEDSHEEFTRRILAQTDQRVNFLNNQSWENDGDSAKGEI